MIDEDFERKSKILRENREESSCEKCDSSNLIQDDVTDVSMEDEETEEQTLRAETALNKEKLNNLFAQVDLSFYWSFGIVLKDF